MHVTDSTARDCDVVGRVVERSQRCNRHGASGIADHQRSSRGDTSAPHPPTPTLFLITPFHSSVALTVPLFAPVQFYCFILYTTYMRCNAVDKQPYALFCEVAASTAGHGARVVGRGRGGGRSGGEGGRRATAGRRRGANRPESYRRGLETPGTTPRTQSSSSPGRGGGYTCTVACPLPPCVLLFIWIGMTCGKCPPSPFTLQ